MSMTGGLGEAPSPRDDLSRAIQGLESDRVPVSVWRHFPERDQNASDLADATVEWQERFDHDFVKFMPPGDYPTIDWGASSVYTGSRSGTRETTVFPVDSPSDWSGIDVISGRDGFHGVMLDALSATADRLHDDVPLLHTIFSPLTIAMKLSNGKAVSHARLDPARLEEALARIAEVTADHARAALAAGADGIFFATQCADAAIMSEAEYRRFGMTFDLPIAQAIAGRGLIFLHLHGEKPMLALARDYPADIVNWHDRRSGPSLSDGRTVIDRCVAGGIDEAAIVQRNASEVEREARDAVAAMNGRFLVVCPGCVIPIDTPEANIEAAVAGARAARSS